MSVHHNNFYSNVLRQPTQVEVILPEPRGLDGQIPARYVRGPQPLPTVWLLHGLGGDALSWLRRSTIESLADQYRVAVVMPQTGRGFYTDMVHGLDYWTYLTTELPQRMRYVFPLSADPQENYVMGQSMGGYGALRWALTMPERFAAVAALSPVTDLARFRQEQAKLMPDFDLNFNPQHLTATAADVRWLLKQVPATSALRVLVATGTRDFLGPMIREWRPELESRLGARFTYQEQSGWHDWRLWNEQLPSAMHWLVKGRWARV